MRKAYYRWIPCYYDPMTEELEGRNWFYDFLLDIVLWVDIQVFIVDYFPIYIEDDNQMF